MSTSSKQRDEEVDIPAASLAHPRIMLPRPVAVPPHNVKLFIVE